MGVFAVAVTTLVVLVSDSSIAQRLSQEPRFERYGSAAVDANGDLTIVTMDGRTVTVRKAGEQTSFSVPVLSSSKAAVGVQAMFPNCCTSYDIPLQLVVYAARQVHRFTGNGLPIFQWAFVGDGTRIAFGQEPVHFGCETHYELRDIESERLIETADIPQPCGLNPNPQAVKIPPWVAEATGTTPR
jgi:hypothetical protein